jgi:hypothetical protein
MSLLAIETGIARDRMTSVLDYGGLPLTAERVVRGILKGEGRDVPANHLAEAKAVPSLTR